jgi:hypothetical protein
MAQGTDSVAVTLATILFFGPLVAGVVHRR